MLNPETPLDRLRGAATRVVAQQSIPARQRAHRVADAPHVIEALRERIVPFSLRNIKPIPAAVALINFITFLIVPFNGRPLTSRFSHIDNEGFLSFCAVISAAGLALFTYAVLAKFQRKPESKKAAVLVVLSPLAALTFPGPAYSGVLTLLKWPRPAAYAIAGINFLLRALVCWHTSVLLPGGVRRIGGDIRRAVLLPHGVRRTLGNTICAAIHSPWIFIKLGLLLFPTTVFSLTSGDAISEALKGMLSVFFDSVAEVPTALVATLTGLGIIPTFALTLNVLDLWINFLIGEIPHSAVLALIVVVSSLLALCTALGIIATANANPDGEVTALLDVNEGVGIAASILYALAVTTPNFSRFFEGLARLIFGEDVFGPHRFAPRPNPAIVQVVEPSHQRVIRTISVRERPVSRVELLEEKEGSTPEPV